MFNAIKILLFFTILTGIIYPLAITGVAQLIFSHKANGSLITFENKAIGSELIAQKFTKETYFWSRPSGSDYVAMPSGATNLSPASKVLYEKIIELKKNYGEASVPNDLLSYSASGLDPHLIPQAIYFQFERVAKARNLTQEQKVELDRVITNMIEKRTLGFLGSKRINVLKLNMTLDEKFGKGF
jgi:K+-transporting ATPase ATPase C chain